jgi:hypothetical protein
MIVTEAISNILHVYCRVRVGLDFMKAHFLKVCYKYFPKLGLYYILLGARRSVIGCGTMLQAGRSQDRFSMKSLDFFNLSNTSSRNMVLGSTQPLTKMSMKNLPEDKGRPARKADNITAICNPIFYKMWEPRSLTTLRACTVCYGDSFTLFYYFYLLL